MRAWPALQLFLACTWGQWPLGVMPGPVVGFSLLLIPWGTWPRALLGTENWCSCASPSAWLYLRLVSDLGCERCQYGYSFTVRRHPNLFSQGHHSGQSGAGHRPLPCQPMRLSTAALRAPTVCGVRP